MNKNTETQLMIKLSNELKDNFFKYCKDNGYSVSKRIRILLENDLKNKEK